MRLRIEERHERANFVLNTHLGKEEKTCRWSEGPALPTDTYTSRHCVVYVSCSIRNHYSLAYIGARGIHCARREGEEGDGRGGCAAWATAPTRATAYK